MYSRDSSNNSNDNNISNEVTFLFLLVKVIIAAVAATVVKCVYSMPNISLFYYYFILIGNLYPKYPNA